MSQIETISDNVRVRYGVASVSRIDKIIGLFCKRALQKRRYSAKETYNFIDPTDRSHPIPLTRLSFDLTCNERQLATMSRSDRDSLPDRDSDRDKKIICLFCKRALQKRRYSAKETCNFYRSSIYDLSEIELRTFNVVVSIYDLSDRDSLLDIDLSEIVSLTKSERQSHSVTYRSLSQNIVSFVGLFCKRDL